MADRQPWIGEYYWVHGPLALGSEAARRAIAKELPEPDRKALVKAGNSKKSPIVATQLGGEALFVLPGANHTRVVPVDKRSVVLVRRMSLANPKLPLPKLMAYEPGWATQTWKPVKEKLVVPKGGLVLFDTIAQHKDAPQKEQRGAEALSLGLPAGEYVVELIAAQPYEPSATVQLLFIHPADHRPELATKKAQPAKPPPLVIAKDVAAAAKKFVFIDSEGGPLIAMPERATRDWWGVCNEAGEHVYDKEPTHYDLACIVKGEAGTLKVGGDSALVLTRPDTTAVYPTPDGVIFLRWVGADHAAALLAAALGPGTYKRTKQKVTSAGGTWHLFDSTSDARSLARKAASRFTLPKGTYTVELMKEWSGEVTLAGKTSDVMAGAVRLRRA